MSTPNSPKGRRRIAGESAPSIEPIPVTKPAAKKASAKKPSAKGAAPSPPTAKPAKTTERRQAASPKPVPLAKPAPVTIAKLAKARSPERESSTPDQMSGTAPKMWFIGAAVAMVLALVFAGWFGVNGFNDVRNQRNADAVAVSNTKASAAAASAAETIFTYQYDKLPEHVTESKKLMTPFFQKQFDKISPALNELAPQNKIVVKGVAQDSAAVQCGNECSPNKASVLIFLDQARLVGDSKTPTVFGNRIIVDMVKSDGRWLVNNVEAL